MGVTDEPFVLTRRRFAFLLTGLFVLWSRRASVANPAGSSAAQNSASLEGPLSADVFKALVGQEFSLLLANRPGTLTLVRVDDDPKRPNNGQFTVTFRGAPDLVLKDGTYRITHASAGTTDLYLRPLASNDRYSHFQAEFNLLPPNAVTSPPVRERKRFERPLYEPPPPPRR